MEPSSQAPPQGFRGPRGRTQGLLALLVVQFFFGGFPAAAKFGLDDGLGFLPRAIAVWRMAFAALAMMGIAALLYRAQAWPRKSDWRRLIACSFFGIALNQVLFIEGMARTSVVHAGLLMVLIPVFTYAIACLARQESFDRWRLLGILVALSGAVLLKAGGGDGAGSLLGDLLIVLNCLSYAVYLVLARPLLARYPSLVVIAWAFLLTAWVWPILGWGSPLLPREHSQSAWLGLAYILLFPTFAAYVLNTYALARVSASTTAVFIYLQPLVAGATGMLFFHEELGRTALLATALLFGGLALVLFRRSAPPLPATARGG